MLKSKKTEVIAEIEEQMSSSSAMIITDYRGLSVGAISKIRRDLSEVDGTLTVSKNTLARIAAERAGIEGLNEILSGPVAIAFCKGDPAPVAKSLSNAARDTKILQLKGAYLDGRLIDEAGVKALATLPPREVLYGRLVGTLAAPISGLATVLAAVPRGLVVALDQIREQKEQAA